MSDADAAARAARLRSGSLARKDRLTLPSAVFVSPTYFATLDVAIWPAARFAL